jgi:hypothetical protein
VGTKLHCGAVGHKSHFNEVAMEGNKNLFKGMRVLANKDTALPACFIVSSTRLGR